MDAMKGSVWKKEVWPERVDAFLMCLGLSLVPLVVGGIALDTSDRKLIAGLLFSFGLLSMLAGVGILKSLNWAPKLVVWLFAIEAVFIIVLGNDGAAGAIGAIPSLLGIYYFHQYDKK